MQDQAREAKAAELRAQSGELAKELIDKVLRQQERPVSVVLEALLQLYQFQAEQLDADDMGLCAMALGQAAGDLLRKSTTPAPSAGTAIH